MDASIMVAILARDSPMAVPNAVLTAMDEGAVVTVPSHWHLEVANFLVQAQRSGKLDARGVRLAIELINHLPIIVDATQHSHAFSEVIGIAERNRLTSYDAAYIHLARTRGATLATLDSALSAGSKAEGVDVLAV